MSSPVLLIHPPVTKPCEPPPGIARLASALSQNCIECRVLDANLEGLLFLLQRPLMVSDTWTERAFRNLKGHLKLIRSPEGYGSPDQYRRAVSDLGRLLQVSGVAQGVEIGLAKYGDKTLSPVKSQDLLMAAERPEHNPFYPYFSQRLLSLAAQESPSVVGLSVNYLSQALTAFSMAGFLRQTCPGIRIVLGGGLVTSWMSRPDWKAPFSGLVDSMVPGPGEEFLLALLGAHGERRIYCPDYRHVQENAYFSPGFILPYSASTGCYWQRCSFCPEKAEGTCYQPIPRDQVQADLRRLVSETRPVLIHFLDNALSPSLLTALVREPPGVLWYGFVRISEDLTDQGFCRSLREAGCAMLKLGLESGSQEVLDRLHKGIHISTASLALTALKSAGIATYVYLLFGTPPETEREAGETLDFVLRHPKAIDFLNLAIFNMPAFGPEASAFETRAFYEGDLFLYKDFQHPSGWDRHRVRQFLDKRFRRHPAIASILRRDPPVFTSNHAPFFSK